MSTSSFESKGRKFRLRAYGEVPFTEVLVIDSRFQLVAHELRQVDKLLPAGIYKVQFRLGAKLEEQLVLLDSADVEAVAPMTEGLRAPRVVEWTDVPFHEIIDAANAFHIRSREESSLFVAWRGWSQGLDLREILDQFDVSVLTLTGKKVGMIVKTSEADAGVRTAVMSVEPGTYRVRMHGPNHSVLEQVVVAARGWQTQVFVGLDSANSSDFSMALDPSRTSIFMSRLGEHTGWGSEALTFADLARRSLALGRMTLGEDELNHILLGKFKNPMFGLYGAHLLLLERKVDLERFEKVLRNTARLLSEDHPDIIALRIRAAELGDLSVPKLTLAAPPMLRASWQILVRASAQEPRLFPPDTLATRVAGKTWGTGPWLVWQYAASLNDLRDGVDLMLDDMVKGGRPRVELFERLKEALLAGEPLDALLTDVPLSPLEQTLLWHLEREMQAVRMKHQPRRIPKPGEVRVELGIDMSHLEKQVLENQLDAALARAKDRPKELVATLGAPTASIQNAMYGLYQKLGL